MKTTTKETGPAEEQPLFVGISEAVWGWLRRPYRFDALAAIFVAIMLLFMDVAAPVFWGILLAVLAALALLRLLARKHPGRAR